VLDLSSFKRSKDSKPSHLQRFLDARLIETSNGNCVETSYSSQDAIYVQDGGIEGQECILAHESSNMSNDDQRCTLSSMYFRLSRHPLCSTPHLQRRQRHALHRALRLPQLPRQLLAASHGRFAPPVRARDLDRHLVHLAAQLLPRGQQLRLARGRQRQLRAQLRDALLEGLVSGFQGLEGL
jgi:hypothetical protein